MGREAKIEALSIDPFRRSGVGMKCPEVEVLDKGKPPAIGSKRR